MARLEGKVAVITGAAGGLGKTTAATFLREGAKVSLVDRDRQQLEQVQHDLGSEHVLLIEADVTQEADVQKYVDQTVETFGSIDVFFNNAGIIGDVGPVDEQSFENFMNVLTVNTAGVFLGLKHVLRVMKKQQSGSIINTSSVDGLRGSPNLSPYATSKHGVIGLTKSASLEVAKDKIRVNTIHPAPVSGEMMGTVHQGMNQENEQQVQEAITKSIPMGHYAEAENIANIVLFLASDESRFVTGAEYRVDGGMGATS